MAARRGCRYRGKILLLILREGNLALKGLLHEKKMIFRNWLVVYLIIKLLVRLSRFYLKTAIPGVPIMKNKGLCHVPVTLILLHEKNLAVLRITGVAGTSAEG